MSLIVVQLALLLLLLLQVPHAAMGERQSARDAITARLVKAKVGRAFQTTSQQATGRKTLLPEGICTKYGEDGEEMMEEDCDCEEIMENGPREHEGWEQWYCCDGYRLNPNYKMVGCASQCIKVAPPPTLAPKVEFTNIEGTWINVGINVKSSALSESETWQFGDSTSHSTGQSNQFTFGVSASFEFGTELSRGKVGVSYEESKAWQSSMSWTSQRTNGGSTSHSCASVDCSGGNLWQWANIGKSSAGNIGATFRSCNFACIPLKKGSSNEIAPMCPHHYCANPSCTKCSSDEWMERPPTMAGTAETDKSTDKKDMDTDVQRECKDIRGRNHCERQEGCRFTKKGKCKAVKSPPNIVL